MLTSDWGALLRKTKVAIVFTVAMLCVVPQVNAQQDPSRDDTQREQPNTAPATDDGTLGVTTDSDEPNTEPAIVLEGFIENDKTLETGKTYLIKNNVKVSTAATLTIGAGTKLIFDPNTSIVVEGGLNINGAANNFVVLKSASKASQGAGLLFRGADGGDISITYTKFVQLAMPLEFDPNWFRNNVTITNCEFRDMNTGESNILLTSPLSSLYVDGDKKASVNISYNNFINNWGSIYIENFQDNVMDLKFNYNLVTNNVVYGIDKGIPSNTPLFGFFDDGNKRFRSQIMGNSIFGNYQINAATDTIIREISIGIQGEGETFDIPNNYFRSANNDYISSTFDHFYQNNDLPLLKAKPVLPKPEPQVHAHIYKVFLEDKEVTNYSEIPSDLSATNVTFKVYFNRPVTEFGPTQLESVYYDTINNGIRIEEIDLEGGQWSDNNTVYTFTVADASFMKNDLGYVIVKNFKDNDGFESPDFTIGQRKAINNYSKLYNSGVASSYFPPAEVINNPGGFVPDAQDLQVLEELSELGDLSYLGAYTSLAKTWELGITAGAAGYQGDLVSKFLDKDDFRWNFSIYGQYNISKWFSVRAAFLHARVTGSDLDESELGRQRRVANFRSNIWEGSLTLHFHLLQYGISKGEKFSPSIFVGVGMFGFNPQSRIFTGLNVEGEPTYLTYVDGVFEASSETEASRGDYVWIPLKPIGTEGQTTSTTDVDPDGLFERTPPKTYRKWNISIPMGVAFDFIINKSWIVGIEGSFRMTFSDYLDDISGYYWDRELSNVDVDGDGALDGLYPHGSIIEANNGGIEGHLGGAFGESVQVPFYTPVILPNGNTVEIPTAALLANPSLAKSVNQDNQGNVTYGEGLNDAFTFPSARKGDSNRDWFAYFGIKVSKVFGYNRQNKESLESTLTDY